MSEEMKNALLKFIENVNVKAQLKLTGETQKELCDALLNMARDNQKGGGFYIADSEMEDLIRDYETTIEKYGKKEEEKEEDNSVDLDSMKETRKELKKTTKQAPKKETKPKATTQPTTQKYESVGLF